MTATRVSTGIAGLDELLGGGLFPGTLTVVLGATGIGKTQLGVSFAHAGTEQEGKRGIFLDLNSRGDSQSHLEYAERMFDWQITPADSSPKVDFQDFFSPQRQHGEFLTLFAQQGRRASRKDLDFFEYQRLKSDLATRLTRITAFFYGNFIQGKRRVVVDGIEPVERASDSMQLETFDFVLHQILRKEHDWLARDLFRQKFLQHQALVQQHPYQPEDIASVLLCTAQENMLDAMIERPLEEGDLLATANTLIYLGKVREANEFRRGLYIAKHRGSKCSEKVHLYDIEETGLKLTS